MVGVFLEGLSYFAVYRLMADAAPKYAHAFRTGILGYIWLAPIGCHLNMGILNMAYKYLLQADPAIAAGAAIGTMFLSFGNAFVFGGLLVTLPPEERFDEFSKKMWEEKKESHIEIL